MATLKSNVGARSFEFPHSVETTIKGAKKAELKINA